MPHVSDFTQSADKIVLDLINEDNGLSLVNEAVNIDLPRAQEPTTKNTQAEVSARPGFGYSGMVTVEYDRLAIGDFVDLYYPEGFVIPLGDSLSLNDIIPEINAGLGISLVEELDFVNEPIEEWEGIPNETKDMSVNILSTSKVYLGVLQFTLDGNDIPLESVLTSIILDGLNLPVAEVVNEFTRFHLDTSTAGTIAPISTGGMTPYGSWPALVAGQVSYRINEGEWIDLEPGVLTSKISIPAIETTGGELILDIRNNRPDIGLPYSHVAGLGLKVFKRIEFFQTNAQPFVNFVKGDFFTEVPSEIPASMKVLDGLFFGATNFNQDISGWDVSGVESVSRMFSSASTFNQDLSAWDLSDIVDSAKKNNFDTSATAWVLPKPNFIV